MVHFTQTQVIAEMTEHGLIKLESNGFQIPLLAEPSYSNYLTIVIVVPLLHLHVANEHMRLTNSILPYIFFNVFLHKSSINNAA